MVWRSWSRGFNGLGKSIGVDRLVKFEMLLLLLSSGFFVIAFVFLFMIGTEDDGW